MLNSNIITGQGPSLWYDSGMTGSVPITVPQNGGNIYVPILVGSALIERDLVGHRSITGIVYGSASRPFEVIVYQHVLKITGGTGVLAQSEMFPSNPDGRTGLQVADFDVSIYARYGMVNIRARQDDNDAFDVEVRIHLMPV